MSNQGEKERGTEAKNRGCKLINPPLLPRENIFKNSLETE